MSRAPLVVAFLVLGCALCAPGQEVNDAQASLSVNGTGKLVAGVPSFVNSSVNPPPPGAAPLYHHLMQARSQVGAEIEGANPGAPIILGVGALAGSPFPLGGELLELNLAASTIIVDGTMPGFINATAILNGSGTWKLTLGNGLPASFPTSGLQGAVIDPTAPAGLRLTGTVTVDVRNDLDTMMRNVTDAIFAVANDPGYLNSLLSSGFLFEGGTANQFVSLASFEASGPEAPTALNYVAVGPDASNLPALPTGAPTIGQTIAFNLEGQDVFPSSCPTLPSLGEGFRQYHLQAVEELGVWKLHGDQREALIEVDLAMGEGGVPGSIFTGMGIFVEDLYGNHGGIASVSATGPQLANINVNQEATSAASGTQSLQFNGYYLNGSEWSLNVQLGIPTVGTSRFPLIENAAGPRDVYNVSVTWNDGTVSGPYAVELRASRDPDADAPGVIAATPGSTASGVLTNAGAPTASLALSFNTGTLPASLHSHISVNLSQGMGAIEFEFEELQIAADGTIQTINLCVPGLAAGVPTDIEIRSQDILSANFSRFVTLTF